MGDGSGRLGALFGIALLAAACPHDLARPRHERALADRAAVDQEAGVDAPVDRIRREPTPDLPCPSPCVTTFAGRCRVPGNDDGPALQATFWEPAGLYLESSSPPSLLVADGSNGVIRRIRGGQVTTLAPALEYASPASVVVDPASKAVLFVDVRRCELEQIVDGITTTVAGVDHVCLHQDGPAAAARFEFPSGLLVDPTLGLVVAERFWIRAFKAGQVTTYAGSGDIGSVDGALKEAGLNWVSRLARGPDGTLYVSEDSAIRAIAGGKVTTFAGVGSAYGFNNGPAAQALFSWPREMVFDSRGAMLVADSWNNRIRRIDKGEVTTFAGSGEEDFADGPADRAAFNRPEGLAIDSSGALYVSDVENYCIRVIR
jgi:serine/threonine protein kinase, bacterial